MFNICIIWYKLSHTKHFRHNMFVCKYHELILTFFPVSLFFSCFSFFSQASRLIVTFDEHVISNNFKFGVIYQKFGQVRDKWSLCVLAYILPIIVMRDQSVRAYNAL